MSIVNKGRNKMEKEGIEDEIQYIGPGVLRGM
jgi:hypothetical protein